jgi:NADH dehydrogenase
MNAPRNSYDYLVVAAGARHSYFGHDEWAPFAPGLKQIEDATNIRSRLLFAFEQAENAKQRFQMSNSFLFLRCNAAGLNCERLQ